MEILTKALNCGNNDHGSPEKTRSNLYKDLKVNTKFKTISLQTIPSFSKLILCSKFEGYFFTEFRKYKYTVNQLVDGIDYIMVMKDKT